MTTEPGDAAQRVASFAARRLHPGAGGSPDLDRLCALAARILRCSSSAVTLVERAATAVGSFGIPPEWVGSEIPRADSFCAQAVLAGQPVMVRDALVDPRWSSMTGVSVGVVGSFLGVPITSDAGAIVGAMCVFDAAPREWTQDDVAVLTELTVAAGAELELAALARDFDTSRDRWDLAIEVAGVGSFDWDLRTGRLSWDQPLIDMFGYTDDERFGETIDDFVGRLHPDDVGPVNQTLQSAIAEVRAYEFEYRIVLPGGTTRLIQARGRALPGPDGAAVRVLGAAWDVSATREGEDRAVRIVEAMPVGYLTLDSTGRITRSNHLADTLLGVDRRASIGRPLNDVVSAHAATELGPALRSALGGGASSTVEVQFGEPATWFDVRVVPEGEGAALYFTDVTDRRRAQESVVLAAAHDRDVAAALQDALLTRLPGPDHLELAARYLPAASGDRVGGDWYDAVVQGDGSTTIVVGDVVGHDIAAAATMGQLRSMVRAFLWEGEESPAATTTRLDHVMRGLYPTALATMITGRVERASGGAGTLRWSSAGHPPAVLLHADGGTTVLERAHDLLLGVDSASTRHDHTVDLPVGSTLLLYTDGLVEGRGDTIDTGIERLLAVLRRDAALPLETLLDRIVLDVPASPADDDIAVLAVRVRG